MLTFQQSETTAERRRWVIILVDSTDGVTGLTGQTGTVKISKNGGAAVDSTNSLVEVDAGDMPGHYYCELTAGELDTLGFVSITAKTAGSLAFHDRAIVSYNDPYISAGGFSGGPSKGATFTKKQLDYIAEQVWKYKFNEEQTAQDVLNIAADHPITDLSSIESKFAEIPVPEAVDFSPVLNEFKNIVIPKPIDYSKDFITIAKQLSTLAKASKIDVSSLSKEIKALQTKMAAADESISSSLGGIDEIKSGLVELSGLLDELKDKSAEMSDMDKRFEGMTSTMQKQQLSELTSKVDDAVKKILVAMAENKFDLLEEMNNG